MLLNKRIPLTYILDKVKVELLYVLLLSVVLIIITNNFGHLLPEMPLTIPAFIGTALSILLSFKLNQSYDRWWEARKVWGSIVNDSRSLIIQLNGLVQPSGQRTVRKIALRQIAWCYSLGRSLRGLDPCTGMEEYLIHDEIMELFPQKNKPLALLNNHAGNLKQLKDAGYLDTLSYIQLDNTLTRLCDAQGKAERIKSTVFPVTYRLFLHIVIYLFVVTLSISLENIPGHFELPLLLIIAAAFFMLEKSASNMQDPFENRPTDTPVTAIARNIEINIRQLIGDNNVPAPLKPEEFFLK